MKKIVFFNISWMKEYDGNRPGNDIPINGGDFPKRNKYAGEERNYTDVNGVFYGHVETIRGENDTSIDLTNLGAAPNDDKVDGVLVIWIATPVGGGKQVIGWWKNATVYKKRLTGKHQLEFKLRDGYSYITKAKKVDCVLLSPIEREIYPFSFPPHAKKDWPGQNSRFYPTSKQSKQFKNYFVDLMESIKSFNMSNKVNLQGRQNVKNKKPKGRKGTSFLHRSRIEAAAVEFIWKFYEKKYLPLEIRDVSKFNKGWDIEIVLDGRGSQLNVEIKGLSGTNPLVGLTPNEYKHFKSEMPNYRLAIVTNCLSVKKAFEIYWDGKAWRTNQINSTYKIKRGGKKISIKEIMSAQICPV